jgi:protein-disulfide isomerase
VSFQEIRGRIFNNAGSETARQERKRRGMNSSLIKQTAIGAFAAAAVLSIGIFRVGAQTVVPASDKKAAASVSAAERESIEAIVRDYLLRNPSIVRDAMLALEIKEARERQELAAQNLAARRQEIVSDPGSPVEGSPEADVTVTVFFDYNCGYCKSTLPALETLLASDKSVRIVFKEFPILGPQSQTAALAALAASRQGKYYEFHRALIAAQHIDITTIRDIAEGLGLDVAKLDRDMSDPSLNEVLDRNVRLAEALGINGTPAYVIGDQLVPGAIDLATMTNIVASERAKIADKKMAVASAGADK